MNRLSKERISQIRAMQPTGLQVAWAHAVHELLQEIEELNEVNEGLRECMEVEEGCLGKALCNIDRIRHAAEAVLAMKGLPTCEEPNCASPATRGFPNGLVMCEHHSNGRPENHFIVAMISLAKAVEDSSSEQVELLKTEIRDVMSVLDEYYSDRSRTKRQTKDGLEELRDSIDNMIDALDLENDDDDQA